MSTIVQRAHGSGSATFPNPTTPGNMLVIGSVYSFNGVSVLQATDDSGHNLYNVDANGQESSSTFNSTADIQYTTTTLGSGCNNGIASARTITAHWSGGGAPDVWIWEILGTIANVCTWDFNNDGGTASTAAPGSGLFLSPTCNNGVCLPAVDCNVCITLCGTSGDGGSVISVNSPFTLEPIQNGNAAAYLIETNLSAVDTVQFNLASAHKWVVKENAYASILSVVNFCGGMASQVVGQPIIKGTAKRVLG